MSVKNQGKIYTKRVISAADILDRLSSTLEVENDSQLARAIGERRSTVGNWRNRNLPAATIIEIAGQHDISLDYLFYGKHESSASRGDRHDKVTELPPAYEPTPLTFIATELPFNGRAQCGMDVQKHRHYVAPITEDELPEPEGLSDDPDVFYVVAEGTSMIPEGISPGDYCLISPNTPLAVGQRLWMDDGNGTGRIKRLLGFTDTDLTLRGWGEPNTGRVGSVNEQAKRSFITRQGAVVGVFQDKPKAGMTAIPAPDPRAYEWQQAPLAPPVKGVEKTAVEDHTQGLVRAVHEAGGDPIPDDLRDVLLPGTAVAEDNDTPPAARPVPVVEIQAAAGGGMAIDLEQTTGQLWFRRDWLDEYGLDATQCAIIGVAGESMEPTLVEGAKILVNRLCTDWRADTIYVVRTGDGLVVKRAGQDETGQRLMVSDHPAWEDIPLPADAEVIGEVVWTARTLRGQ